MVVTVIIMISLHLETHGCINLKLQSAIMSKHIIIQSNKIQSIC